MNYPSYYYPAQYLQQPMYQPQMIQGQQAMPMQNQQSNQNQPSNQSLPIRKAGFIMVRSEEEAYNYPVELGNCVTFKVENEPIVIEKSMSYSQLENPKIDRYRLVREDIVAPPAIVDSGAVEKETFPTDELKDELVAIRHEIEGLKKKLDNQPKQNQNQQNKKREVEHDG